MINFNKLESQLSELELLVLNPESSNPDRLARLSHRFPAHFVQFLQANHPAWQLEQSAFSPYVLEAQFQIRQLLRQLNRYFVNSPRNYVEHLRYESLLFTLKPHLEQLAKHN